MAIFRYVQARIDASHFMRDDPKPNIILSDRGAVYAVHTGRCVPAPPPRSNHNLIGGGLVTSNRNGGRAKHGANGKTKRPSVIVLGGDGYCGWPTALYLSDVGMDVCIADNFSRRTWDHELNIHSLTPIATLSQRIEAWKEGGGRPPRAIALP